VRKYVGAAVSVEIEDRRSEVFTMKKGRYQKYLMKELRVMVHKISLFSIFI